MSMSAADESECDSYLDELLNDKNVLVKAHNDAILAYNNYLDQKRVHMHAMLQAKKALVAFDLQHLFRANVKLAIMPLDSHTCRKRRRDFVIEETDDEE